MPCTISWLIDVHSVPGKPYRPLNAGVAPGCERMNSSAIASSSIVDMPARTSPRSICTVAARIRPPSAIVSISRALLSWITSAPRLSSSARQRAQRACRDVLHTSHRVDHGDSRAVVAIPLQHRRGLPLVHREAIADRLRLVVLAANELAAILVA